MIKLGRYRYMAENAATPQICLIKIKKGQKYFVSNFMVYLVKEFCNVLLNLPAAHKERNSFK